MSEIAFCYILYNDRNAKTYNGYTVNIDRRIRQHNGLIKGGARFTTADSKKYGSEFWKYLLIIECDEWDKVKAQSVEWSVRYPNNKRPRPPQFSGADGRIIGLQYVFSNPKFANLTFRVKVCQEYFEFARTTLSQCSNANILNL
jgi:predicted GIY-YIG superfamily endonuclease